MPHTRQFESGIHHALPRQAHLQSAGMQAGIDRADVEHDEIAIVLHREAGRKAYSYEGFVRTINTGENAEAVAPLHPQVLQGFPDGCFLPV